MSTSGFFARRFLFLRLLSFSLVLGALYDLGFGVLMILAPQKTADMLSLPLPGEDFYLWLLALFLFMLAALYLQAARDPRRYSGVILVAIVGRFLGAVALTLAAWGHPELRGLYPLAAVDLLFAAAHGLLWVPTR